MKWPTRVDVSLNKNSNKYYFCRYIEDEPFADLHKVEGMRGVYIASQLINKSMAIDHQRTLITFDKGGEWQLVEAPDRDVHNQPTNCSYVSWLSKTLYTGNFNWVEMGSVVVCVCGGGGGGGGGREEVGGEEGVSKGEEVGARRGYLRERNNICPDKVTIFRWKILLFLHLNIFFFVMPPTSKKLGILFLYARLKNGTYYVLGYGVRPSVRKLFCFRLTPPTVYIWSSWNLVYS